MANPLVDEYAGAVQRRFRALALQSGRPCWGGLAAV